MIARFTVEIELSDDQSRERQLSDIDVCRTACQHVCFDNLEHYAVANVVPLPMEVDPT